MRIDRTGNRFGKLVIIKLNNIKNGKVYWECLCDCGKSVISASGNLTSGNSTSCGCGKIPKPDNLIGFIFGKLLVLGLVSTKPVKWNCSCLCGNTITVSANSLRKGSTSSCGCYRREVTSKRKTTHGKSETALYAVWSAIKRRCYNETDSYYYLYGGRGVRMCSEWRTSFEAFDAWAQQTGYSKGLSIDRINTNSHYSPDNCRWSTPKEQANNRRSCTCINCDYHRSKEKLSLQETV